MSTSVSALLKMSDDDLKELFISSPAGEIPDGETNGTAIIPTGTIMTTEIALLINVFAWQGKIFDPKDGCLRNRILPFGLSAIIAQVYKGNSLLDNKECIIIDYSKTSLIAHWVRDEIRQIDTNLYLGVVYLANKKQFYFSLETHN